MWMTIGALLVALGVVLFVLHPLVTGRQAPLHRGEEEPTEAEARKRVTLLALRDLEYDYATGKLDDRDYQELRKELASEALEALEAEEAAAHSGDADVGGYPAARSTDELEQEIAAYRAALRQGVLCPSCAHLNEEGSRFCGQCGTPLSLEPEAPATAGVGIGGRVGAPGGGGSRPGL